MAGYQIDKDFKFKKVTRSVSKTVWGIVKFLVASVSMAVLFYIVATFFFSTDTERQLRTENRLYEQLYDGLVEKQELVGDVVADLEQRDNTIYGNIFHTVAPDVDPASSARMSLRDSSEAGDRIMQTAAKASALRRSAAGIEDDFMSIFARLAEDRSPLPPMSKPVEEFSYAQTGASVGQKISPFTKVETKHDGLDLIAGEGEPVYATADGTVISVTRSGKGLGNVVEIDHGNGYVTRYAHLADILVSKGQKVVRGKRIASVGISGNSYAPHLHYEVLRDGVPADPVNYMFLDLGPGEYANVSYMSSSTGQSMD